MAGGVVVQEVAGIRGVFPGDPSFPLRIWRLNPGPLRARLYLIYLTCRIPEVIILKNAESGPEQKGILRRELMGSHLAKLQRAKPGGDVIQDMAGNVKAISGGPPAPVWSRAGARERSCERRISAGPFFIGSLNHGANEFHRSVPGDVPPKGYILKKWYNRKKSKRRNLVHGPCEMPVCQDTYSQYGSLAHSSMIFLGGRPPRW
jgi:hypothetical protein